MAQLVINGANMLSIHQAHQLQYDQCINIHRVWREFTLLTVLVL